MKIDIEDLPAKSSIINALLAEITGRLRGLVKKPFGLVVQFLPDDNPVQQLLKGQMYVFKVTIKRKHD